MVRRILSPLTALLLLTACPAGVATTDTDTDTDTASESSSSDGGPGNSATTRMPTTADDTGGPASTTTTTGISTTTAGADETTAADTGSSSTGVSGPCQVDLLVALDSSGSMANKLPIVRAGLEDFAVGLDDLDLHVMVVDIDADPDELCVDTCQTNPECFDECAGFPGNPNCIVACTLCPAFDCDAAAPDPCDVTFGAGLDSPQAQPDAPDCGLSSGARYVDPTEPDLGAAVECISDVGVGSTSENEPIIGSALAALDAGSEAAVCNEGFRRPDASLALLFATDESDDADTDSEGTPVSWVADLEAAGDPDRTAVLGLFGDGDQQNPICPPLGDDNEGAEVAPRLAEFIDSYGDRGLRWSICAQDLGAFYEQAEAVVRATCG